MPFDLSTVDTGATAWVLASSAMVLLMAPGLAFFYGGMVRAKNVLGMLMQNFTVLAIVSVLWVVVCYSLVFGEGNRFIGDLHFAGLANLDEAVPGFTGGKAAVIPPVVFVGFQMMFAVITVALITGATAERWKFASFVTVITLWVVVVYSPVAHWVFSPGGWAARMGALDFAGGTVVHVNAGAAAVAMAVLLGRRRGWPEQPMRPHNLPFVLLGTGLLWFGWFGFNAGSALNADTVAGYAFVNTNTSAAAGTLAWITLEKIRYGKPTTLGAASGAIAGLVAATPGAGFISPIGAAVVGLLAGALCALAVATKTWLGYDDSLDVASVHLVAGVVGSVSVGLLATTSVNPDGGNGLFYGGGYALLGTQAIVVLVVIAYVFVATLLIGSLVGKVVGNRVTVRQERIGLDLAFHGESAYESEQLGRGEVHPPAPVTNQPGQHQSVQHQTRAQPHTPTQHHPPRPTPVDRQRSSAPRAAAPPRSDGTYRDRR